LKAAHACPSCGSTSISGVGQIPPADNFAGRILATPLPGGSLCRCGTCHLLFRFPLPGKDQLDEMYRDAGPDQWQYAPRNRMDWQLAARVIKGNVARGKILDVGCFDGQFLAMLADGYDLAGVEVNPAAARRARERGIRIIAPDYAGLPALGEHFDAVVATDVVEHAGDPLSFLDSLRCATRAGGIIVIATGNSDSLPRRMMGSKHLYCAIPEHLSFVNPGWCRWAADRLGLQVESTAFYRHSSVGVMQRAAGIGRSLTYRLAPGVFAWLRRRGLGGIDIKKRPAMAATPPEWPGAIDHFLTVFRRN
jgi:SAM-dependent methyltransferase